MKKILIALIISLLIVNLSACKEAEINAPKEGPFIYYLNSTRTSMVAESYNEDTDYEKLLESLSVAPVSDEGYVAPLNELSITKKNLKDKILTIDFGREYTTINATTEILVRACIVKTLIQSKDVDGVEFLVGGDSITDALGNAVGIMDKDTFVDYLGSNQNSLESGNFTVYYLSDNNESLVAETHRYFYENTLSKEQAVIKCMQDIPEGDGCKVAISPKINIINITTTDGTCYLDMDMSFYDPGSNADAKLALMAIVNSLCELDNIRHVQISIIETDKESAEVSLSESLSGTYEKDNDIIIE